MKKAILIGILALLLISTVAAIPTRRGPPNLKKITFIHYKKGYGKPGNVCGNGICEPGEKKSCPQDCPGNGGGEETDCYTFLMKGLKWKDLPVEYVIDPDNKDGLSESFIVDTIYESAEEWDAHTSTELFNGYTINYETTFDETPEDVDLQNEIMFGQYPEPGVIAVTRIWYTPRGKKIVDFDIMFDNDWIWGDATINNNTMDLQNIATHELGHGVGLGDLYDTVCIEETMYGFSWYGDTGKRDLHTGDIIGIQKLYGA